MSGEQREQLIEAGVKALAEKHGHVQPCSMCRDSAAAVIDALGLTHVGWGGQVWSDGGHWSLSPHNPPPDFLPGQREIVSVFRVAALEGTPE